MAKDIIVEKAPLKKDNKKTFTLMSLKDFMSGNRKWFREKPYGDSYIGENLKINDYAWAFDPVTKQHRHGRIVGKIFAGDTWSDRVMKTHWDYQIVFDGSIHHITTEEVYRAK